MALFQFHSSIVEHFVEKTKAHESPAAVVCALFQQVYAMLHEGLLKLLKVENHMAIDMASPMEPTFKEVERVASLG